MRQVKDKLLVPPDFASTVVAPIASNTTTTKKSEQIEAIGVSGTVGPQERGVFVWCFNGNKRFLPRRSKAMQGQRPKGDQERRSGILAQPGAQVGRTIKPQG
jgi:hypothetical protein